MSVRRILLTGAAGCGKGTIAKKILENMDGFAYFCAGDVIRRHISEETEFGKRARSFLQTGEHVPENLINDVILQELNKLHSRRIVLDGFPRTLSQVSTIEKYAPLSFCVELEVPKKVILDRLNKRWIHTPSGRTYNLDYNPPLREGVDDVTGEPLERRVDDSEEAIRRRFEVYAKTESKVAQYYKSQGLGVTVKGDSSDLIWPVVHEQLEALLDEKHAVAA